MKASRVKLCRYPTQGRKAPELLDDFVNADNGRVLRNGVSHRHQRIAATLAEKLR